MLESEKFVTLEQKRTPCFFESRNYRIFLAEAEDIPNLLLEIGRLREITFREVGEGTNKSMDLDPYDSYYKHLFLWDSEHRHLVGAYRMGMGGRDFQRNTRNLRILYPASCSAWSPSSTK